MTDLWDVARKLEKHVSRLNRAELIAENARLNAENERLSTAVCSGILGDLLTPDESEALVQFVKMLRGQRRDEQVSA
jgi:hypothetical protein